ncbi:TPA: YadA family autotransporter adhesin, partial [Haemophilus influenzae]
HQINLISCKPFFKRSFLSILTIIFSVSPAYYAFADTNNNSEIQELRNKIKELEKQLTYVATYPGSSTDPLHNTGSISISSQGSYQEGAKEPYKSITEPTPGFGEVTIGSHAFKDKSDKTFLLLKEGYDYLKNKVSDNSNDANTISREKLEEIKKVYEQELKNYQANHERGVNVGNNYYTGPYATTVGSDTLGNAGSVVAGTSATAYDFHSIAIGSQARVGKYIAESNYLNRNDQAGFSAHGIAIGRNSKVYGSNSVALGADSEIDNASNSVALGNHSIADESYTVSVGSNQSYASAGIPFYSFTRRIVNVSEGIRDTDAATYGQLKRLPTFSYEYQDEHKTVHADNIIREGNNFYDTTGLIKLEDGNYYRPEDIKGKTLGVDRKFYDTEKLKHFKYLGSRANHPNKVKKSGYYLISEVEVAYSTGNAGLRDEAKDNPTMLQGESIKAVDKKTMLLDSHNISLKSPSTTQHDLRISHVADGVNEQDAVNVRQLNALKDETQKITPRIEKIEQLAKRSDTIVKEHRSRIEHIEKRNQQMTKEYRAGIASAIAIGGLQSASIPGKQGVSVGVGNFKGANSLAVGYSRLSSDGSVSLKINAALSSSGYSGGGASVGFMW